MQVPRVPGIQPVIDNKEFFPDVQQQLQEHAALWKQRLQEQAKQAEKTAKKLGGLSILLCGILLLMAGNPIIVGDIDEHGCLRTSLIFFIFIIYFITFIKFGSPSVTTFRCRGAIPLSHCMIVIFAVLLLTLVVVQGAVRSYGFITLKDVKIENTLKQELRKSYNDFYTSKPRADAVNSLQTLANCCGYDSYTDFLQAANTDPKIPYSCCKRNANGSCSIDEVTERYGDKLNLLVEYSVTALGGLALVIGIFELTPFINTYASKIRNLDKHVI